MNTSPNSFILISVSLLLMLICAGFFFTYQHLIKMTLKKTVILDPLLTTTPLANKTFDLSKEKSMTIEFYFALGTIISITLILTICVGGLIIEYFIKKAHLMGPELFIFLILASAMIFIGSIILLVKQAIQPLLQIIALCKCTREKEIIFNQDKVLFSIGLVNEPANALIKEGHPYIEIPFALVKEIKIRPTVVSSGSGSRSIPERLQFILNNSAEVPEIKTYPFGKYKDGIIEELRKRTAGQVILVNYMPE